MDGGTRLLGNIANRQERKYRREVAEVISVVGILNGNFQEAEDGTTALNVNGKLVKRVNLLATVVAKNEQESQAYKSIVVDDSTGQIRLRFFSNDALFEKSEVGDLLAVMGMPRSYGGEKYIVPEIIKPVKGVKWAEARKLELKIAEQLGKSGKSGGEGAKNGSYSEEAGKRLKAAAETEKEDSADAVSKEKVELYRIIKELDTGRGADMAEVTVRSGSNNAEKLIREMIRTGDVFEVLPGRLKVLE